DYFGPAQLPGGNVTTNLLVPTDPNYLGKLTPTGSALTTQINFPSIDVSSFAPFANVGNVNVAARWTGQINIPSTGLVSFRSESDDGSVVFIDGIKVVDNNFFQGAPGNAPNGSITLTAGLHIIEVDYMQGGGGASEILKWDPTGGSN